MRKTLAAVFTILLLIANIADAREWYDASIDAPDWGITLDAMMGCGDGSIIGYGLATDWSDECQVCFRMPYPEYGGPWLVEYIAFFMSGTSNREVVVRTASGFSSPPGLILGEPKSFTPGDATWPPADWTYVKLYEAGSEALPYLLLSEDDLLMIGVELLDDDVIGLGNVESDINGWGLYDSDWIDDSGDWNLTPAIRIGLTDTGLTPVQSRSWGQIKTYF